MECRLMWKKTNLKQLNIRQQHNKTWKKWRGMNTFTRHCIQNERCTVVVQWTAWRNTTDVSYRSLMWRVTKNCMCLSRKMGNTTWFPWSNHCNSPVQGLQAYEKSSASNQAQTVWSCINRAKVTWIFSLFSWNVPQQ